MQRISDVRIHVLAEDFAGYSSRFWVQHGISFFIEMKMGMEEHRILFDTGNHAEPVLFNAQMLALDLGSLESIVLSHSHYDHTGGLLGVLEKMEKEVNVIAHPDIFKESYAVGKETRYIGPPRDMRERAETLGARWILHREPWEILPGVWTLGEILNENRVDYEVMRSTGVFMKKDNQYILDFMEDEIGLAMITEGGLVVVGGCSHPGIVGMVKRAVEITGMKDIRAVIGGFHLVNAGENRIKRTVRDLLDMGVKEIYTGHCTGLRAECEFSEAFGDRFHKLHAGMSINLSER